MKQEQEEETDWLWTTQHMGKKHVDFERKDRTPDIENYKKKETTKQK